MPIEVIASRGFETLRHGPLKPFGLWTEEHPRAYAIAQLRQDTKLGDYYNLVGFQTNLTYPEQKRVFQMIPGLEHAEFLRYGLMHRNSYINAPKALNEDLSLKNASNVYIAGQLSGVEGYVESAATGIIAAINLWRKEEGKEFEEVEFVYEYDMASFLSYYCKAFSLAGLSRITGVNQGQLSHYVTGHRTPSEKTKLKIQNSIQAFAKELSLVHFL